MTGFARRDGGDATVSWTWEVKSVNGRSLAVRARLPLGYESLDPIVRRAVTAACSRGNLQVNLARQRGRAPLLLLGQGEVLPQGTDHDPALPRIAGHRSEEPRRLLRKK